MVAFCAANILLPPISANDYRDSRALAGLKTLELALRPKSEVKVRINDDANGLKAATTCVKDNEHKVLLKRLHEIESRLAIMANLDESGVAQGNQRLPELLVVDAEAWTAALLTGRTSFDCQDLLRGLAWLTKRDNGAAMKSLRWSMVSVHERKKKHRPIDDPWMTIPPNAFTRATPWGGLPGCILFGDGANAWYVANGRNTHCATASGGRFHPAGPTASTGERKGSTWVLPDSLSTLLSPVDWIRLPSTKGYQNVTTKEVHGPNKLKLDGHERDAGFHVQLTLDPTAQRVAQQTARCYVGDSTACTALGLSQEAFQMIGGEFYERAAVRMTGVAIIDVKSGRIEALASAHTKCYHQQYDGAGRDKDCPQLTRHPSYSPDMLLNHAIFSDAMPASTVKPILALGFLETPGYKVKDEDLTRELKRSNSERFLDRLFCLDTSAPLGGCPRLAHAQAAATQLGWNSACAPGGEDCGFVGVLFGRESFERIMSTQGEVRPLDMWLLNGRLFAAPLIGGRISRLGLMSENVLQFDSARARECQGKQWRKCTGNPVATLVAEGWGQGNARVTPLGVAAMFARLGAAANGQKTQRRPYLVNAIYDIQGKELSLPGLARGKEDVLDIRQELAFRVVNGLREGHWNMGTANLGCASAQVGNCDKIRWVAGKTGTPPFGFDRITLEAATRKCSGPNQDTRCYHEIPYKWYAALFQSGQQGKDFDKAIAVLSERNWHITGKHQGMVDAPGDRGPNRSAEIAFRIMGRLRADSVSQSSIGEKQ